MKVLGERIGQVGSNPEVFGHHPTDSNRHPLGAAALAFLRRGRPSEAFVAFNQRHHHLINSVGETGIGQDSHGRLRDLLNGGEIRKLRRPMSAVTVYSVDQIPPEPAIIAV